MNKSFATGMLGMVLASTAYAGEGLYAVGTEPEDGLPLSYMIGSNLVYDDNVLCSGSNEEDSFAVEPYVGAAFVSISPQTLIEMYAKLGMIYYFDAPDQIDDVNSQSRLNLNIRHNITERLGINSNNMISYEMEPNYDYGYASSRRSEEHYYWSTDNYLSFRWSERLATRTGFVFEGLDYQDSDNSNRITVTGYHQFRYQWRPLTILTAEYRYGQSSGDGASSDSTDQYILVGAEHRVSPNAVGMFKVGAQLRDVDQGSNSSSPFAQLSFRTIINEQWSFTGFARYGLEMYDTVQILGAVPVEFDERETLRIGLTGAYKISPVLSAFGGVNYVPTTYSGGRVISSGASVGDQDEDLLNAYLGLSMKFTDNVSGSVTYSYTDSDSDIAGRDYDRSRISVGIDTQF